MMIGTEIQRGIYPATTAGSRCAYVTLVTNADYARGALALTHSIQRTCTSADIVILHPVELSGESLAPLAAAGCRMIAVDPLPLSDAFIARHDRDALHAKAPFTRGTKPDFHTPLDNFCKLRLWQLMDYHTCVFIDADAIMLRNCDRLFDYPEFSAAPNVYEGLADFRRLNSGVFVARPSHATFNTMLNKLDIPDVFWKRTDQSFLESYFPEWHGLPVYMNMLQYVWFSMPMLWDWKSIHILHYQYEKPWDSHHAKSEKLKPLIDLWMAYFHNRDIPDIGTLENPASNG